jgi:hypothetical protein
VVILYFNYEELAALRSGARVLLGQEHAGEGSVLAPTEERAQVEDFLARLDGDLSLSTLHELQVVQAAVRAIVDGLRVEMESAVLATHAADEGAVAAYFDFAHGLTVSHRLGVMAAEMEALIELVTGAPPTYETARSFQFPD